MTLAAETTACATIVLLQGQINSVNAAAVEAQILALVEGGAKDLVLEFGALDYISSAGLRVVLVLAKRLKKEVDQSLARIASPEPLKPVKEMAYAHAPDPHATAGIADRR